MYSLKEILHQASEQNQAVISDQPVGFNVIKRGVKKVCTPLFPLQHITGRLTQKKDLKPIDFLMNTA